MFIGCREVAFARYIMLLKDLSASWSAPYNSLFIAAPGVAKATRAAPRGLNAPGAATGARWGGGRAEGFHRADDTGSDFVSDFHQI